MKEALNSMLSGKDTEDVGTAAPYESDFSLAGEDDMEGGEGDLLSEVQGMLATASPEQLQQVKDILGSSASPEWDSGKPPMDDGGDMGLPM
jgi:hypothetical protein